MTDGGTIVAFCCENSGAQAAEAVADEAVRGALEIVRLPCSGRVEVGLVLKALERGRPGVLVLGCPKDCCKYLRGSHRAEKRVRLVRRLLKEAGVEEERVRMEFIASVDPHRVAEAVRALQGRLDGAAAPAGAAGPRPLSGAPAAAAPGEGGQA